ncbi:MAG: PAS domain S-box protein [Anaerolineaceae bacterium]|nr:PAS domain S-box protein [Anaerolineaceae bacterium]
MIMDEKAKSKKKPGLKVAKGSEPGNKQIEEALRESEERYQALFERSLDCVYLHDFKGNFIDANPAALRLLGYQREEITSLNFDSLLASKDQLPTAFGILKELKESGIQKEPVEFRLRRKDGSTFWVETLDALVYKNGKPYAIQGVARDISERKRLEERLQREVEKGLILLDLHDKAARLPDKELYDYFIEKSVQLTGSTVGFFHMVSEDQKSIILVAWNDTALQSCSTVYPDHYLVEEAGNWADCFRLKRPVIYNDFPNSPNRKGLPEGHPQVKRFLSVPVFEGEKCRIIFGVGNKAEDYDEQDVIQLQLVADYLQKALSQRRSEELLQESEKKYHDLFDTMQEGFVLYEVVYNEQNQPINLQILTVNPALEVFSGIKRELHIGKTYSEMVPSGTHLEDYLAAALTGRPAHFESFVPEHKRHYDVTVFQVRHGQAATILVDISERKRAEAALEHSNHNLRTFIEQSSDGIAFIDEQGAIIEMNQTYASIFGINKEESAGKSFWDILLLNASPEKRSEAQRQHYRSIIMNALQSGDSYLFEHPIEAIVYRHPDDEKRIVQQSLFPINTEKGYRIGSVSRDITDNKKAEEAVRESEKRYRSLFEESPISLWEEDFSIVKLRIEEIRQEGVTDFRAFFENHPEIVSELAGQIRIVDVNKATLKLYKAESKAEFFKNLRAAFGKNLLAFVDELVAVAENKTEYEWEGSNQTQKGENLIINLRLTTAPGYEKTFGKVLVSILDITERRRAEEALSRQTGELLQQNEKLTLLNAQTERRMQQLTALHNIDKVISGSFDIGLVLNILLEQVTKQLSVHAADILIFNPVTQTFRYTAGQGFRTLALQHTNLRLGDGYAGRVVRERQMITIQDLAKNPGQLSKSSNFSNEGFVTYIGVPLIAKGHVKGVLEIFQREELLLEQEQETFLEMLANQAAIAIDSGQMVENLQASNVELMLAYDETIEGWSRALDLRDEETEGHTQRVAEMTLQLANSMPFNKMDLVHIRWGALLHDIGKIGVPDEILRKPGPLTEEEWVKMRRHPQFAYDMLASIAHLRPALDIPYCHHEKWDGTGYPRGLKGEQIPISARLFAIVDIWDALTSDRPYRKAWPEEKALSYIRVQAGLHFDPRIVDLFLAMISEGARE